MVQLIAIIVREITQRHKYRWHVTTEKYIIIIILLLYYNYYNYHNYRHVHVSSCSISFDVTVCNVLRR